MCAKKFFSPTFSCNILCFGDDSQNKKTGCFYVRDFTAVINRLKLVSEYVDETSYHATATHSRYKNDDKYYNIIMSVYKNISFVTSTKGNRKIC